MRRTITLLRAVSIAVLSAVMLQVGCASTTTTGGRAAGQVEPVGEAVSMKVALIDFFPALGNLEESILTLTPLVEEAFSNGAQLVVAPELATTGYSITAEEIEDGLGLVFPAQQLDPIAQLARAHDGFVYIGVAEIAGSGESERLYNSVFIYGPDGPVVMQRKRGIAAWNVRGDLPFDAISTRFGELAGVICSDSYLQDWVRISTLHGADVVVAPANWWGETGQVGIWQTRAQENGAWLLVANRWGTEVDHRFDPPYTYDMNDAPTTIISPDGEIQLLYRANESPSPSNEILYSEITIPQSRIGGAGTTYSVVNRRPSAYTAIANDYYRPDKGNQPAPGLPPAGETSVAVVTFTPSGDDQTNLETITTLLGREAQIPQLVVLPGLALGDQPIRTVAELVSGAWGRLGELVEDRGIEMLVTSAYTLSGGLEAGEDAASESSQTQLALVVLRPGEEPVLQVQIHDAWGMLGSGEPPLYIDLSNARVGLLTGVDLLFPETATQLAKCGVDIVAVSSVVASDLPPRAEPRPSGWSAEDLTRTWRVRTDQCFHLVGSDAGGTGAIVKDGGCFNLEVIEADQTVPIQVLSLDSSTERKKNLNYYYDFDLQALLGGPSGEASLGAPPRPVEAGARVVAPAR